MTLWNRQRPGRSRDRGAAAGDLVYDLEKPEKGKDGRGTAVPPPAISLLKKELDRAPPPAILGYARVSTDGQTLEAQEEALRSAGATKIFSEKISGAVTDRKALAKAIAALGADDVLLVNQTGSARQINQGPSKRAGNGI